MPEKILRASGWLFVIALISAAIVFIAEWLDLLLLERIAVLVTGILILLGGLFVIGGVLYSIPTIVRHWDEAIPMARKKIKDIIGKND